MELRLVRKLRISTSQRVKGGCAFKNYEIAHKKLTINVLMGIVIQSLMQKNEEERHV